VTDAEYQAEEAQRLRAADAALVDVALSSDVPLPAPKPRARVFPEPDPPPEPIINPDELAIEAVTPVQSRVIGLLALGMNKSKAARTVGITREQIHGWFRTQPAFVEAFNEVKREIMAQAIALASSKATEAVLRLIGAMESPRSDTPDIIRAANSILRFASEAYETQEVIDRIDALEEKQRNPIINGVYRVVPKEQVTVN
jgi:hypothetical protein